MDENDEVCLGLDLGLGLSKYVPKRDNQRKNKRVIFLDLSIPPQSSDRGIADSGFSNEKQGSKNNSFCNGDDESNYSKDFSRKKLRLTGDQTTLLEDSFKQHSTLNTAQKQALAERLNLKPRQVEVWFQNRRARTKLKQTEVDCEFLKKKCEKLSEENRKLKKELLELRSEYIEKPPLPPPPAAPAQQFFYHIPKAVALTPSGIGRGGGEKHEGAAAAATMEVVHEAKPNHA
ncbi:hypothetical protein BUALT_Bualt12G0056800 [Buddleja alternifolia]|uniref:Homeobox domain-containing protein n=1 Tax=Buddleja alternifolia TaxID=168488 RepID=A0AAV6WWZ7_9LAMI|nr:hypothetical protein BUALT_Bualt12G0056800 [Buddleja alternifolia]